VPGQPVPGRPVAVVWRAWPAASSSDDSPSPEHEASHDTGGRAPVHGA